MRRIYVLAVLAGGLGGWGCSAPLDVQQKDSAYKIGWMKQAASGGKADDQTLGRLVKELDNADPAVRFYCIRALEVLTGESNGYVYYADEAQREGACARWKQWLEARGKGKRSDKESGVADTREGG